MKTAGSCLAALQRSLAVTTPKPVTGACGTVSSIFSSCTQTLGASAYLAGPAASRALCLCYDGAGQYAGERWDSAESECSRTGSSVFPGWWSAVSEDGPGWCSSKSESAAMRTSTIAMVTTAPGSFPPVTSTQGFVTSTAARRSSSAVDESLDTSFKDGDSSTTSVSPQTATTSGVAPESSADEVPGNVSLSWLEILKHLNMRNCADLLPRQDECNGRGPPGGFQPGPIRGPGGNPEGAPHRWQNGNFWNG